jgi:hypothetical protein
MFKKIVCSIFLINVQKGNVFIFFRKIKYSYLKKINFFEIYLTAKTKENQKETNQNRRTKKPEEKSDRNS